MMKTHLVFAVCLLIFGQTSYAAETIVIGLAGPTQIERGYRIGQRLTEELSKRISIPIELIPLPAQRARVWFKEGRIHAELSRIAAYQEYFPTAIRVEEPIGSMTFYVYTLSHDFKVNGWESLRPYKIVTLRGLVYIDQFLENHDTFSVTDTLQAIEFLKKNGQISILPIRS